MADRWFRFHSLPESKRYAENETEIAELLKRQNQVLLDVIGGNSDCVLVSGNYTDLPILESLKCCSALSKFQFQEFTRLSKQDFNPDDLEPDEESPFLNLFCGTHNLKRGSLDEVLLCIANEQIVNFFAVSCEQQRIFAPYDGGVDVILKNKKERDVFKAKYKSWLSHHPAGL